MAFNITDVVWYHGALSVHFLWFLTNGNSFTYIDWVERPDSQHDISVQVLWDLLFILSIYDVRVLSCSVHMVREAA